MDVVQFTVCDPPKHILSLVSVNAKIERVQRCEPLIPNVHVTEELQNRIAQKYDLGIFVARVQQESIVLQHRTIYNMEAYRNRQTPVRNVGSFNNSGTRLLCSSNARRRPHREAPLGWQALQSPRSLTFLYSLTD